MRQRLINLSYTLKNMTIKKNVIAFLNTLPYVKGLYRENFEFKKNSCFPAGHYYSPIISLDDIQNREQTIWAKGNTDGIVGIDLRMNEQIKLIDQLSEYYPEIPFKAKKQGNLRYQFENDFYRYTDGIILYSLMRHIKPKRIIEIGSGFSSAVMLDTNELFFDNCIHLTFIEPYTERLYSLLTEVDKKQTTLIETDVQSVSKEVFEKLQAGDILFIDSTHIVKTGSDVNYILFEILPSIPSGVYIHFHDIFYPFEYPKNWVLEGRNWNEVYFLKAFLMYNSEFEITLFSDYIHLHHKDAFKKMPLSYKETGGSLWMMKK